MEPNQNSLSPQEILSLADKAFEKEEFYVLYQPQYNHSSGMLLGAEALVRWKSEQYGVIYPDLFVPLFEDAGLITRLDLYVFERVCRFLRECINAQRALVPVSVNISRHDILLKGFAESLDAIRRQYDIPVKLLALELTESAVIGTTQEVVSFINTVHQMGYKMEMDDFGSGSSSLNVLKDVDFDVIKLDLRFLQGSLVGGRGGTIVSSIVRMAKWLGLPVIAEGVETVKQADFMRSIGCDYIQGYLYSKPIPQEEYQKKLVGNVGAIVPQMSLVDTLDAGAFWSPESLETLIFSNYVGGASIFEYKDGKAETLRVNQKFLKELGMNLSEKDLINSDLFDYFGDNDQLDFKRMLEKALETNDEAECENWWNLKSQCCGEEKLCIRTTVRVIGKSEDSTLFYASIRNITAEKNRYIEMVDTETRFKMASEQVNIYFWEYTVATHEMRPCFRCMRDLGLPALVTNYPDTAIEMGIFPPEVADMYRDWHRQIAEGVPSLEAVIPLTVGRVPFLVRYTTEFDENGRPIKAYGSAALVVDKK